MRKRHLALWGALLITVALLMSGCRNDDTPTPTPAGGENGYPGNQEQPDAEPSPAATATPVPGAAAEEEASPGASEEPDGAELPTESLPAVVLLEQPPTSAVTPGSTVEHTVREGEWLLQIARCYGADYQALLRANRIGNPDALEPGSTITVPDVGSAGPILGPPCTQRYQVAEGDTFQALAERFQTSAAALQGVNPGMLFAGREIVVPVVTPITGETILPPQDMIFNYNGNVAVWRAEDGQVALYPGDFRHILGLTTGQTGRFILAERTVDAGATSEIVLIDRRENRLTILEQGIPPAPDGFRTQRLLVTPDEQWAAYIVAEEAGYRVTWLRTGSPAQKDSLAGLTAPTEDPRYPRLFADQMSGTLLWIDRSGIYRIDPAADAPRQLLAIDGEDTSGVMAVEPVAWSPAGDLLLLRAGFLEGYDYQLFDPLSGSLVPLPRTGSYVTIAAASWTGNGQVAVLAPPVEAAGPELNIYQPLQADGTLSVELLSLTSLPVSQPEAAGPGYIIDAPALQPVDGALIFYLNGAESDIWLTPAEGTRLTRLNTVPPGAGDLFWSTDGRGVIFQRIATDGAGAFLYIPLDGGPSLSLTDWLGREIRHFHWVGQVPVTAQR